MGNAGDQGGAGEGGFSMVMGIQEGHDWSGKEMEVLDWWIMERGQVCVGCGD